MPLGGEDDIGNGGTEEPTNRDLWNGGPTEVVTVKLQNAIGNTRRCILD